MSRCVGQRLGYTDGPEDHPRRSSAGRPSCQWPNARPRPVRGHKTICIPCSQQEYERVVDDPERVPQAPRPADRGHARAVPAGDRPGLPHEGHLHLPQDRLQAPPDRTPQRPVLSGPPLLPDALPLRPHRGRAGPPFLRKFAVPFWALTEVFGRYAHVLASPGVLAGPVQPGRDDRPGGRAPAPPPGRRREAHHPGRGEGLPGGHRRLRVLPGDGPGRVGRQRRPGRPPTACSGTRPGAWTRSTARRRSTPTAGRPPRRPGGRCSRGSRSSSASSMRS